MPKEMSDDLRRKYLEKVAKESGVRDALARYGVARGEPEDMDALIDIAIAYSHPEDATGVYAAFRDDIENELSVMNMNERELRDHLIQKYNATTPEEKARATEVAKYFRNASSLNIVRLFRVSLDTYSSEQPEYSPLSPKEWRQAKNEHQANCTEALRHEAENLNKKEIKILEGRIEKINESGGVTPQNQTLYDNLTKRLQYLNTKIEKQEQEDISKETRPEILVERIQRLKMMEVTPQNQKLLDELTKRLQTLNTEAETRKQAEERAGQREAERRLAAEAKADKRADKADERARAQVEKAERAEQRAAERRIAAEARADKQADKADERTRAQVEKAEKAEQRAAERRIAAEARADKRADKADEKAQAKATQADQRAAERRIAAEVRADKRADKAEARALAAMSSAKNTDSPVLKGQKLPYKKIHKVDFVSPDVSKRKIHSEFTESSTDGKKIAVTATKYPDGKNATTQQLQEARADYALRMSRQLLSSMNPPPGPENPVVLSGNCGQNKEVFDYMYGALIASGVSPDSIKIETPDFHKENVDKFAKIFSEHPDVKASKAAVQTASAQQTAAVTPPVQTTPPPAEQAAAAVTPPVQTTPPPAEQAAVAVTPPVQYTPPLPPTGQEVTSYYKGEITLIKAAATPELTKAQTLDDGEDEVNRNAATL